MKKILVVDDEFGLAEALEALLADDGYRVTTAVNGVQGLEKVNEFEPDLVLIDYMMPVMNGPDMLKALRQRSGHAKTPVIMMSGVPESMLRADVAGYSAFLRKPFEAKALLQLVRKLIG